MRVMVLVKATDETEAGRMPKESELAAMGEFNETLVRDGVLLAGEGLHPSSQGARVVFGESDEEPSVVDGPFAETKELVAGFWLLEVGSLEEATERMKKMPNGPGGVVEIRRVFEAEDFGEEFTPELREREEQLRDHVEGGQAG